MSEVIRLTKKTFTVGVVIATIAWSLSLASLIAPMAAQGATLVEGDLIKASLPSVYYYAAGKRYVFPNEKTYKTWYPNFSGVKTITDAELAAVGLGGNVTYRPGVKMVKITTDPKVYAVDKNGSLRWIASEAVASALYGATWAKMVEDVPDAFFTNYTTGANVAAAADLNVSAVTTAATSIASDKGLSVTVGGTPVPVAGAPVGSGLTIALAADTPSGMTLISDGTNNNTGSSVLNKVMALNFTASSDGDVKVNSLKFKRAGVSADSDIRSMHLQGDDGAYVSEYTSIASNVVTFNNASGLFTVAKGTTKKVWLLLDVGNDTAQGKTYNFTILTAADVVTNGAAVSGSYPVASATHQVATVSDFGRLQLSSATQPSQVDPGQLGKEILRFNVQGSNQKLEVRKIKFTEVGTIAYSDLTNLKLMDGATQLGVTATGLASDGTVTFDMTANPYVLAAGVTRTLSITADLSAGSINRNFELTIQRHTDMRVWDTNYSAFVAADSGTVGAFSVFEAASNITTGAVGKLTITVRSDSPSGNIIKGATDVEVAKWDFSATGEAVKITDLYVNAAVSDIADATAAGGLDNGKLLVDGVQVGTTTDLTEDDPITFTLGGNFIIPAGATRTVILKADTKKSDATAHTTGATLSITLSDGSVGGLATGQVSLASVTFGTSAARTLTFQVGTVAITKNQSFADRTSTNVTGVPSALGVKIGSFVVTAGTGEAADLTQFKLGDSNASRTLGEDFQNLKIKNESGVQIGTTVSTLNTTDGTYTFTPNTAIRLNASQQYVIDAFVDVLSSVTNSAVLYVAVNHDKTSATGVTTGSDVSDDTDVDLQNVYLGTTGNLTITLAADTPDAMQYTLGQTGVVLAKFRFQTDSAEDINLTRIIVSTSGTNNNNFTGGAIGSTGTIKNIKLWDTATNLQVGPTVSALASANNSRVPYADFSGLSLNVAKNNSKTLEVRADFSTADEGGVASSSLRMVFMPDYQNLASGATESIEARGAQSGSSITTGQLDYGTSPDVNLLGNAADAFRSKLTLAFASDTPTGASSPSTAQIIAKIVASNAANSGNYAALLKNMNPTLSQAGISLAAPRAAYVYKNSITSANQLGTTTFNAANAGFNLDTTAVWFAEADFTDVEVAANSSVTLIITLDTSDTSITDSGADSLSIVVSQNNVNWDDDNNDGTTRSTTQMNGLPLLAKTLTYS